MKRFKYFCGVALLFLVPHVHATFTDLGTSTVDQATGLEWLDVTATLNRVYDDVFAELGSGSGLGAGGWRYATQVDFRTLISNFFGITYTGGVYTATPFGSSDNVIVEDFIAMFGDTFASSLSGSPDFTVFSGFSWGLLNDTIIYEGDSYRFFGQLDDREYSYQGAFYDQADFVCDTCSSTDSILGSYGSWLVRTYVPEPSSLVLLFLGLFGLGWNRRHQAH